jgi:hypothetical protein
LVNPNHLKSNQVSIDFGLHEKWISDNLCKSMKDCITKSGSVTITLNQKPAKWLNLGLYKLHTVRNIEELGIEQIIMNPFTS